MLLRVSVAIQIGVFCWLSPFPAQSQEGWKLSADCYLEKHVWTKRDGLPDWFVRQFFQDRDGLIWIITNAGIHTFDGIQFRKVFTDSNAPGLSSVSSLAEDVFGNIWLVQIENDSKHMRFFILDKKKQTLIPLHQFVGLPQPVVLSTLSPWDYLINRRGIIWIVSKEGLFRFDGAWEKVAGIRQEHPHQLFLPAPDTLIWSWTPSEQFVSLKLFDAHSNVLDSLTLESRTIKTKWVDNNLDLWVAEGAAGRLETKRYTRFSAERRKITRNTGESAPSDWFNNNIPGTHINWLIPHGFALEFKKNSKTLGTPDDPGRFEATNLLPDLATSSRFFVDQSGGLWTSSTDGLMRFLVRPRMPFQLLLTGKKPVKSVRSIAEWGNQLWVNTYDGLKQTNPITGQFKDLNGLGNQIGLSSLVNADKLLIGTYQYTLVQFGLPLDKPVKTLNLGIPIINCLHKSASGRIFLGTNAGLYRFDDQMDSALQTEITHQKVVTLLSTKQGIWAGTSKGLFLVNESGTILREALVPWSGLQYDYISHIYEAPSGVLWLSTKGAGIIKWDPISDEIQVFDTHSGLSNNNIHAIYPDSSGNFWLPSDFGLMCFHPEKGVLRTFFEKDGLANDEFNLFAHLKSNSGRLFFGGIDGITAFYPNEVPIEDDQALRLKALAASAFEVETGTFVQKHIPTHPGETLIIEPNNAYLEISVSPMVFEANENPNLVYGWMVEGFHESWVQQASNIIRISNLPYGNHLLRIRCRRVGNPWSGHELSIPITVQYPYYLRWPFITSTALSLIALTFLISFLRNRQLRDANRRLEHEVAKRTRQIEDNLFTIDQDRKTIEIQSKKLLALDEMKSRFFANIAHELRTPLTLILGPIDSLMRQQAPISASSSMLLTVRQNALKLLNLVEELLDLSKMEAQKMTLEERPVVFFNLLSRLVAAFTPYARHRDIELRLLCDFPVDYTLMLDPNKWEKIVNNLLSNALKFTPNGGKVTLSAGQNGSSMVVRVTDTGQGIHPDDLPYVFDRFFQSKHAQSEMSGGTGIGLSLCKEYASLFGGKFSVESTLGQGTSFSLLFMPKVAVGTEPESSSAVLLPQENHGALSQKALQHLGIEKYTVMVVEDDPFMLQFIQSILQNEYDIISADNGKKAIQILENSAVDLLLSDIMMPEMDGYLLLEAVRASHPTVPFVMLTARSENGDRLKALRLGVDDYISKPFFEEELTARVRNLISRHQSRKAAQQMQAHEHSLSHDQLWLQALESAVKANLHNPEFSVRALSELLNLTERTLQNKLKAYVGITPSEYITEARLVEAKFLLENRTYATVSEVCFAVGFKTPRHFAAKMKNRFGRIPSSYQNIN